MVHLKPNINFTISNCVFSANNGAMSITNMCELQGVSVEIINTSFLGNRNYYEGSGGAINAKYVDLLILDSQFINNSARSIGGAIFLIPKCSTIIKNTVFSDNTASSGLGGSVLLYGSATCNNFIIESCWFIKNSAHSGGAIACMDNSRGFALNNVLSTSNSAIGGDGGFAYLSNCTITITDSSISNNEAVNGGALHVCSCKIGDYTNFCKFHQQHSQNTWWCSVL